MKRVFIKTKRVILLSMSAMLLSQAVPGALGGGSVKAYVEEKENLDGTYTYTDTDTGETVTAVDNRQSINPLIKKELDTWTIETESYLNNITLNTSLDVARLGNFRTNSDALKIKIMRKHECNYGLDGYERNYFYVETPDGFYYRDINGNRKKIDHDEIRKTNKYEGLANYRIRLYTKKTGKYQFSYDALDHDGNVIATKTIRIVAKKDASPIKEATFGGKRFYVSNARRQEGFTEDLYNKKTAGYTSKKSGKLKVIMNKGFKLKKLEIGYKDIQRLFNSTEDEWYSTETDVIWRTVTNGKKIKLQKPVKQTMLDRYIKKPHTQAPDGYRISEYEGQSYIDTEYVRVTYYDKKDKSTKRMVINLDRLVK